MGRPKLTGPNAPCRLSLRLPQWVVDELGESPSATAREWLEQMAAKRGKRPAAKAAPTTIARIEVMSDGKVLVG